MPAESIESIIDRIRDREQATLALRARMDEDYLLYRGDPYIPPAGEGMMREDAYTSPRPKIVADKLIGAIAAAEMVVRVHNDAENEEGRDVNNNYERLGIGMLRHIDRMLYDSGKQPLRFQLGFYGIVRGGYVAARALLKKDIDGETYEDVLPIDPRHLMIEFGHREPIWAAVVTVRSRKQVRDEYPDFKFESEDENDRERQEKVIDYYYIEGKGKSKRYMNCVIIDRRYAKKPSNTFAARFPIVARAVGANPGVHSYSLGDQHMPVGGYAVEDFGESIFAPIRNIIKFTNRLRTYRMALTRSAVKGVYKVYSQGGEKEIEGGIDEATKEIALDSSSGEDVKPLEIIQLTRDTDTLEAAANIDLGDATLPEQSFGRLDQPVSGIALRILGSSIGERLEPYIRPVESCVEGIVETLAAQYETGRYKPLKVHGKTYDSQDFNRPIEPKDIEGHGEINVTLEPDLPEDRLEKWQIAALAHTPGANGQPVVSDQTIWDRILNLQDGNLERTRIHASMARTSPPTMLLMTQLEAAWKSQDVGAIQFLQTEIRRLEEQKEMEDVARRIAFMSLLMQNPVGAAAGGMGGAPARGGGGGQNPNGSQPNPAGLDPQIAPMSGTVFGNSTGPVNANGNPGPRSTEDRLTDIGLRYSRR